MTGTIEMLTRAAAGASTFDPEARTVEVVWTSDHPVKRYSWEDGYYMEVLDMNPKSIRMDRFKAGMSLLDSHDNYSMDNRLGTVLPDSVRIKDGKAVATVKLSRNARGESLFRDLADGHPIQISVGYRIHKYEKTEGSNKSLPTFRAVDWEPMELSAVAIPADPNAFSRSVATPEEKVMTTTTEKPQTRAEKQRQHDIRALAKSSGLTADHELIARAVDDDMSIDQFRAALLDHLIAEEEKAPTFPISETRGMADQLKRQNDARVAALVARMSGKAPEGEARDFMGATLMDHARGILEAQGVSTRGMSREQILGYRGRSMHTTSDFPMLLQSAGERVLMESYGNTQSPLKTTLSRASTATDFRTKSKLKIGDAGLLEKLSETGEIKHTTRSEAAESYKIDSYGRIFALSFQSIVNDDLGAFADFSREAGRMAALTENKVMLDLLLANSGAGPTMSETGQALFSAAHKNVAAAGTALDMTALEAAVLAFRLQTTVGGKIRLGATPRYILTGPELEMTAQRLVASITPATTAAVTPAAISSLVPLVEPNLDGKSWYLFADPGEAPVFEHAFLDGYGGPQIDSRDGFERLGTEFRCVLHYGGGCVDFRGGYRNPGIAPE